MVIKVASGCDSGGTKNSGGRGDSRFIEVRVPMVVVAVFCLVAAVVFVGMAVGRDVVLLL